MVVQVGINHTQSGPALWHIVPDKKSFYDDDDDDDEEEEEEDHMKEMRLCTPSPPPPAKKIDFITQHPPLSKTRSIIGPNSAPNIC